jgi:hypothetical protein
MADLLTPRLRKFALTAHVASSVGSLGAVASFLTLAIYGLVAADPLQARAMYIAMGLTAWIVVAPLLAASLVTGIIQALGTPWGLFQHHWVLAKFLTTVFVAFVLAVQIPQISYVAEVATQTALSSGDLWQLRMSLVVHAGAGLLVLLLPTALSIYKPRGLTRYGLRVRRRVAS